MIKLPGLIFPALPDVWGPPFAVAFGILGFWVFDVSLMTRRLSPRHRAVCHTCQQCEKTKRPAITQTRVPSSPVRPSARGDPRRSGSIRSSQDTCVRLSRYGSSAGHNCLRLKLLNEEVLKPGASRKLLLQPLGFDPPAGPGLRGVFGVAVFRRDGSPSVFRRRLAVRPPLFPARCGLSNPVDTDLKPRLAGHGLKFIKPGLDALGKRRLGILNQVAKLPVIQAAHIDF
jgi:hypothetical protein